MLKESQGYIIFHVCLSLVGVKVVNDIIKFFVTEAVDAMKKTEIIKGQSQTILENVDEAVISRVEGEPLNFFNHRAA